jgi:hypothetical protein
VHEPADSADHPAHRRTCRGWSVYRMAYVWMGTIWYSRNNTYRATDIAAYGSALTPLPEDTMTTPDACTPRCRQFLADLEALCARYEVHLTPSGSDTLQIWRMHPEDPGGFDWKAIEDCTPGEAAAWLHR